jgi:hypothetical protein
VCHALIMTLTVHQQELLELERRYPRHNGNKILAVAERFDLTIAEYERQLAIVLEMPSARDYDSELVAKVKRLHRGERWFHERQQAAWH